MDSYEKLAEAIILRAVSDYRAARRSLKENPRNRQATYTVAEIERFFRSQWFGVLTTLDGRRLIEQLQKEVVR